MKKRFYGILLLGAMMVASMSMFTSCTDYDDDIADLQKQLDAQKASLAQMQKLVDGGSVITGVDQAAGGVTVSLSNGQSFVIKNGIDGANGADGANGTVWTIDEATGKWMKDGVLTDYQAIGVNGKDGSTPYIGENMNWWIGQIDLGYAAVGKDGINGTNGTNGTNGVDGLTPKIGDNGNWWIGTTDTGVKAAGIDGANGSNGSNGQGTPGTPGADGLNGKYYVPNDKGTFDVYEWDAAKKEYVKSDSGISYIVSQDAVTAFWTESYVDFKNVDSTTGKTSFRLNLTGKLKALTFMPKLYLDGIEAIEYPWIGDTILKWHDFTNLGKNLSHHGTVTGAERYDITGNLGDYLPNTLGRYYDKADQQIKQGFGKKPGDAITSDREWIYGPVKAVQYHMNPSNVQVDYATNVPSFYVLEPDVIYYNTRAAASALGVSSPKTYGLYGTDKDVFGAKDGILTVGLQIAKPNKLAPWPTDNTINPNGNTDSSASYPAPNEAGAEASGVPGDSDPGDKYTNAAYGTFGEWYGFARYEYNKNNTDNTVALQMHNCDGEDVVTSDYALIVPSRVQLEGLIWYKAPMYAEPDLPVGSVNSADGTRTGKYGYGPKNRVGDEEGWAKSETIDCTAKRIHIWDSPEEALADADGAALELGAIDPAGLDLTPYLGVHYVAENIKHKESAPGKYDVLTYETKTWKYGEEKAFGLHYEFELVDYTNASNSTRDSRYATFSDWTETAPSVENGNTYQTVKNWNKTTSKTGVIIAQNVTPELGLTCPVQSTTSVDREPLVRVMLKNQAGKVLLDGYILLHINNTPDNLHVDNFPVFNRKFDLCNPVTMQTTWSEFNTYLLTQKLGDELKLAFDDYYMADCMDGTAAVATDDAEYVTDNAHFAGSTVDGHARGYQLKIFNLGTDIYGNYTSIDLKKSYAAETSNAFENKALGDAVYFPNGEGPTNHTFYWTLSEEELEYLTHDKTEPVTVTRWFRFIAKDRVRGRAVNNYSAPYPYIWVKMSMTITRDPKNEKYAEKINNYWYHYNTGAIDGWSGILLDIQAPRDGFTIKDELWNSRVSNTLVENYVKINGLSKYYFAPKPANGIQITTLKGNTYTLTPKNVGTNGYVEPSAQCGNKSPIDGSARKDYRNDGSWDQLFCKYVWPHSYVNMNWGKWDSPVAPYLPANATVKPAQDKHTWNEATLKKMLDECSIDYNAGVFNDSILYAERNGVYTPIARITQQEQNRADATTYPDAGNIELIHWLPIGSTAADFNAGKAVENTVCYEILNAIGYPTKADGSCDFENSRKYINAQLRAWLGVVANNGCDVAKYVAQEKYDDQNIATFLASWERPINLNLTPVKYALDAKTNENIIWLLDCLKLFDWRGDKGNQGYMYEDHQWFWAYYNVKEIDLDMRPQSVYTNMHQDNPNTFVRLDKITTQANLWAYPQMTATYERYQFNLTQIGGGAYEWASKNNALLEYMGIKPDNWGKKAQFGAIYYANNGDNVTEFDIRVPVTIRYEWGDFTQTIQIHIFTTHGRD